MADKQYPTNEERKVDGVIYKIVNLIDGKIYIGQTIRSIAARWRRHKFDAHKGKDTAICRAIRKYGDDAFIIEEIDHADNLDHLNELEEDYIASLNTLAPHGYNLCPGGKNHTHLPEACAKISQAARHRISSQETRLKISEGNKGKIVSAETRAKMSIAQMGNRKGIGNRSRKGQTFSAEERNNMSIARIGKPIHTEESKAKIGAASRARVRAPRSAESKARQSIVMSGGK